MPASSGVGVMHALHDRTCITTRGEPRVALPPSGKDQEALRVIHEALLAKSGFVGAERHLRTQLPGGGNVPGAGDCFIHHRVVVLQSGTDADLRRGYPTSELGNARP